MVAQLKVVEGRYVGSLIPVRGPRFIIGQARGCHLRSGEPNVEGQHCELLVREGRLALRDLGTSGGTLLNGLRILPECTATIRPGDRIRVGNSVFELADGQASPEAEGPDLTMAACRLLQRRPGESGRLGSDAAPYIRSTSVEGIPVYRIQVPEVECRSGLRLWRCILGEQAAWSDAERMILDLGTLRAITPEAGEALRAFRDRLSRQGRRLKLCNVPEAVVHVLEGGPPPGLAIHLDATMAAWSAW